jgi:rhodanese-related sulfurtransferase/peroxiredoxin
MPLRSGFFLLALLVAASGCGGEDVAAPPAGAPEPAARRAPAVPAPEPAGPASDAIADPTPAPDFTLPGLDGDFALADQRGRVVVLNFWATWNDLSLEGLDALARLHEDVGDAGVVIVGIAEDEDALVALRGWAEANPAPPFPLVADTAGAVARSLGGVELLPTTMVVDRQGLLRARHTGILSPDGLLDLLGPILIEEDDSLAVLPAATPGAVTALDAADVPALVRAGAVLVDVREDAAWRSAGALPYALHRPLDALAPSDLPANFSTPLVFVDEGGEASGEAAKQALAWGYVAVYVLDGGVEAWEAAGLPLEPAPPARPAGPPVVPAQSVLG